MAAIAKATQAPKLPEGAVLHELYNGRVQMVFNPNSPRYRYTVTDPDNNRYQESVRGVTTVLRDIIHKPDLMAWPMNMSHQKLFGAKWNEDALKYVYTEREALLKVGQGYTIDQYQEFMEQGAKAYLDRSQRGKDIGTMVHRACELYLKDKSAHESLSTAFEEAGEGLSQDDTKATEKAFAAFQEWWDALPNKRVVSTEAAVYSRSLNYSGTADLVAEIDGKTYMLDLKTTNSSRKAPLGIYAEYFMQLGAYSYAYKEETGTEFDDLGIIRVSKEGKLSIATAKDMGIDVDECERAFAFAIRVHDWLEKTTKWLTDAHFVSHLNRLAEGRESDSETN